MLEIAEAEGIAAAERPFTLFDVWTADEVFVCVSGAEIVPVLAVDARIIGAGAVGPVTARIIDRYAALVRSTVTAIPRPHGSRRPLERHRVILKGVACVRPQGRTGSVGCRVGAIVRRARRVHHRIADRR